MNDLEPKARALAAELQDHVDILANSMTGIQYGVMSADGIARILAVLREVRAENQGLRNATMDDAIAMAKTALNSATLKFYQDERHHAAKSPPDTERAETSNLMAKRCHEALHALWREEPPEPVAENAIEAAQEAGHKAFLTVPCSLKDAVTATVNAALAAADRARGRSYIDWRARNEWQSIGEGEPERSVLVENVDGEVIVWRAVRGAPIAHWHRRWAEIPVLPPQSVSVAKLESLLKPPDGWTVIEATIVLFRAPYSRNHTLRSGTVAEPVDLAEMLTDAMESARKRSGAGG